MLKHADIFIEDKPPATVEKMGFSYPRIREITPRTIHVSLTPFGQSGPYRDYKGYAINCSALGGQSVCAGEPGREPLTPPLSLGHYQSGAAGAAAAMAALLAREVSGQGQHVDISEAQVWATLHTGNQESAFVMHGMKRMRWGHRTPGVYPYTILPCQDGYMSMIAIQGYQWKRFLEMLGDGQVPEWYSKDPRFQDRREISLKYADEMDGRLAPWLTAHTKAEIYKLCLEKSSKDLYSKDFILFQGVEPHLRWNLFVDLLFDLVKKFDVSQIFTLGGTYDYIPHTYPPMVSALVNDEDLREKAIQAGLGLTEYTGPISIHTFILESARKRGLKAMSLWGHAPQYLQTRNMSVVHSVIRSLFRITGMGMDLSELEKASDFFVQQVKHLVDQDPTLQETIHKLEEVYRQSGQVPSGEKKEEGTKEDKIIYFQAFLKKQEDEEKKEG